MRGFRSVLLTSVCMLSFCTAWGKAQADSALETGKQASDLIGHIGRRDQSSGNIKSIRVIGNTRIETNTVLSYMVVRPGDSFNQDNLDRSLKTLYATGLFKDVVLRREGDVLVVRLRENPIVNRIVFEGNYALKDDDLRKELFLKPKTVFSAETVGDDRQRILDLYAEKGRFSAVIIPQIVKLAHNRVDVVFKIDEGPKTVIRKIAFVGNKAFSGATLSGVISSKEAAWYRFLSSSDLYNPERVKYDAELLRHYYLKNGYVDFQLKNVKGELSPDRKSFYVTFDFKEGIRYRLGKIDIRSSLNRVPAKSLRKYIELFPHQWYNGKAVQDNATDMEEELQADGHPFARVRPIIARNPERHIVNLLFDVSEGPRRYIERIDINGNTVTEDKVIRQRLPFAEGDPYTPSYKKYAKMSVKDMGYFKKVDISDSRGSASDKVNVALNVHERPTGQFSAGGGYSTNVGVIGNIGIRQRNLLGTGISAGFSGTMSMYQRQADLSVTDPSFLGRNMVVGSDVYFVQNHYMWYQNYQEGRYGIDLRMGYAFNRYLSQSWNYTLLRRWLNGVNNNASWYLLDQEGKNVLSELRTVLMYDRRDSRILPHSGYYVTVGGTFAGLGGNERFFRARIKAAYFIPLDSLTNSHYWTLAFRVGVGELADWGNGQRNIMDNFYLGGNNLRGFMYGGVGPRTVATPGHEEENFIGGRFMYDGSVQLNFPIPFLTAMGVYGHVFSDFGSLAGVRVRHLYTNPLTAGSFYTPISGDTLRPRVSVGAGVLWKSPFGILNINVGEPVMKSPEDVKQLFRFGFGQRF